MDKEHKVGIVMGSKSDLDVAKKVFETLQELDIEAEVTIASAHRTPGDAKSYAENARDRGIKVIIAIAGLSAALPGVIAAHTSLPVIGVPVNAGTLGGIDALLSIAQMPPGVPVAAMGIEGAKNAALMAARIIALQDMLLHERLCDAGLKGGQKVRASRTSISGMPLAPEEAFAKE
ncbi:MAG TPA: 5-(carboxyamino)imidazole ribonucleotide mutase [Synergistaceae bacterium]|jgi:5-(carboxyamino)imidazole ribonucleotide mutase|nr:MAG: N5-carboxyaminoimidazole ribonucleotide mutase [Synergistales bacterium 53_16]KUL05322.1 MAG: N5-carboxyaminoimidazole ribonucleotide mutase [Synergistales bacterium 54_9]MDK2845428.1 5-(carboxyamino)imidazole ribonucleotide mutase [Synergistales bacterium]HAA47522.1 5-(carboxyamino)imidazole ribonucleotide mutase [Synergistaceae bacterium]MDN5336588.1 5-(carboxyamino)imidazole ribonucleotide mutase [Synergistales bacterium]